MDRNRQWLMTKQQIDNFDHQRQKQYKHICQQQKINYFPDQKLTTYYINTLLDFLHKRKRNLDFPFQFQKMTFMAITLYKKYRLLRSFIDQQPTQSMICSLYVALKICQFNNQNIQQYGNKWRVKPVFQPHKNHYHFGDQGYTQIQLIFLATIGFQTGVSPLINSIQSLYIRIISHLKSQKESLIIQLINYICYLLRKVYLDYDLIFLIDGPKIALSIIILVIESLSIDQSYMGQDIIQLWKQNSKEIDQLCQKIKNIPDHNNAKYVEENNIIQLRKITKAKFKKPEIRRTPNLLPKNQSMIFDKKQ